MKPLVSVIVPTFNRPAMLRECLQSIAQQTYGNIEIIVVNDGGGPVREMVSALDLGRVVHCIDHGVRKGPAAARNSGIRAAKGEYIAYLDDDDTYYSNHIEVLVNSLETRRSSVAYSDSIRAIQYRSNGECLTEKREEKYSFDFDTEKFLVSNYIPVICVVHRKDCVERAGYFDENLFTHEDWDFFIRLSFLYGFDHVRKITCEYRLKIDDSSATTQKRGDFIKSTKLIHRRYRKFISSRTLFMKQKIFIAKQFITLLLWKILVMQESITRRKYFRIRKYLL